MSLDKAIEHGKEHRKRYTGSKAIDRTCRNHGGCPWCEENRKYSSLKRAQALKAREEETLNEKADTTLQRMYA